MKYHELLILYNNSKNEIHFWRSKDMLLEEMPKAVQTAVDKMYECYQELTEDERFRLHRPGVFDDELAEEFAYKRGSSGNI